MGFHWAVITVYREKNTQISEHQGKKIQTNYARPYVSVCEREQRNQYSCCVILLLFNSMCTSSLTIKEIPDEFLLFFSLWWTNRLSLGAFRMALNFLRTVLHFEITVCVGGVAKFWEFKSFVFEHTPNRLSLNIFCIFSDFVGCFLLKQLVFWFFFYVFFLFPFSL